MPDIEIELMSFSKFLRISSKPVLTLITCGFEDGHWYL